LSGTEFTYSIEQGWRWSRAIQDGTRNCDRRGSISVYGVLRNEIGLSSINQTRMKRY
jgi:hypothetical protein